MFRAWLASQLREIADDVERGSVDAVAVCMRLFGLEDQDMGEGKGKGKGKDISTGEGDGKGKGKGKNSELGGKGNRSTPY